MMNSRVSLDKRCLLSLSGILLILAVPSLSGQQIHHFSEVLIPKSDYTAFIKQANENFHWLGNGNGLHRFDGQQLVHFYITDSTSTIVHDQNVQSPVFEDAQGMLWFSTYSAVHRFSPIENSFATFQIEANRENILEEEYRVFHYDSLEQNIWLRAGASLWALNTQSFEYRKIGGPTESIRFQVRAGKSHTTIWGAPWMNTTGIELFHLKNNDSWEKEEVNIPYTVTDLVTINNQQAYLATNSGLFNLRIEPDTFTVDRVKQVTQNPISSLVLNEHQLWLAQPTVGVICYDINQGRVVKIMNQKNGLSSTDPFHLTLDNEANLWISYLWDGIDYFSLQSPLFTSTGSSNNFTISDQFLGQNSVYVIAIDGLLQAISSDLQLSPSSYFPISYTASLIRPRYYQTSTNEYLVGNEGIIIKFPNEESVFKSLPFFPYRGLFQPKNGPCVLFTQDGVQEIHSTSDSLILMPCRDFMAYEPDDFLSLHPLSDTSFLLSYRGTAVWKGIYQDNQFKIVGSLTIFAG